MLCINFIFTMIIVTIIAIVLECFRNKHCMYVSFLGLNISGSNSLIFCWNPHFWVGYVAEYHVDSSIADNLYVVGGSIGIPITGSKIKKSLSWLHLYECISIPFNRFLASDLISYLYHHDIKIPPSRRTLYCFGSSVQIEYISKYSDVHI